MRKIREMREMTKVTEMPSDYCRNEEYFKIGDKSNYWQDLPFPFQALL